jgi:hypothetical protein
MKIFAKMKDGGPESTSHGYWLVESKRLLSVLFLRFDHKSRDAFHTHAFNSISWLLKGKLVETMVDGAVNVYTPSWKPIITKRSTFHKVDSVGVSWAFSLRGPWVSRWNERLSDGTFRTLTNGRKVVQ